jgi:hypothetical protein
LTYVTLDEANGGIVCNLNHEGIAVQAVGALRPRQNVRVRFELHHPRLRVEARGEVMWSRSSGQCGIRFLDLPPRMTHQIDEWILGNLLESASQYFARTGSMFASGAAPPMIAIAREPAGSSNGLVVSSTSRKVIQLGPASAPVLLQPAAHGMDNDRDVDPVEVDWLSQPLSGQSLAWTVDALVVIASLLLFSLVFLLVARELPRWPVNLEAGFVAVLFVATFYWGFFHAFGGASLGARLARMMGSNEGGEDDGNLENADRFR